MTFDMLRLRLIRFGWIILLFAAIGGYLGFTSFSDKVDYRTSIGLGISYNSPEYFKTNTQNHADSLTKLGSYLENRFKSIEIQNKVAAETGIPDGRVDNKKAFFDVVNQENGFVSLVASFDNVDTANRFLTSVKRNYRSLIEVEKNQIEGSAFKIRPMDTFNEAIITVKTPIQFRLLPLLAGFMFGLLLVLVLPIKTKMLTHEGGAQ